MRKLLILLVMTSLLAGCGSAFPKCDGKDRRPINVPQRVEVPIPSCGSTA